MSLDWIKNPLTRKRFKRLRAKRRAWWSLWILAIGYCVSLGSELLCGDRPLVVRYEGQWFFPLVRFCPEATFVAGGRHTRPDYRALKESPAFASSGNFMLMPPIPFSPYESIDPASISAESGVTATLTPVSRVGSLNLASDYAVIRAQAAGGFFATNDEAVVGANFARVWKVSDALSGALAKRFRNEPAPAYTAMLPHVTEAGVEASVSLPAFSPRAEPPNSVRVTLRQPDAMLGKVIIAFGADGQNRPPFPDAWNRLPPDARLRVMELARAALSAYVPPATIASGAISYTVDVRRQTVTWPHRPVPGHWMGIDIAGRDVLARILYGFRISMSFGFLLVMVTMGLGIALGAVQGYFGGWTDMLTQRLIEIWSALPFLYVMILLGSVYGRSFSLLLVCYGMFNWIGISYYVRGEFYRLRRAPYVEAARCLGVPAWRIMTRHILPNALTPVITLFPFSLVGAIFALYGLDFLGFGIPPPKASWGELLQQGQQFPWAWWLIFYPAAAIFVVMLLGVFVGEGIRDAVDPKPFSRME